MTKTDGPAAYITKVPPDCGRLIQIGSHVPAYSPTTLPSLCHHKHAVVLGLLTSRQPKLYYNT
jgi:hypothetical protein